ASSVFLRADCRLALLGVLFNQWQVWPFPGCDLAVTNTVNTSRRSLAWTLRIVVLVVVCVGVSGTVRGALAQLSEHSWTVNPLWLVLSGAAYVVGMAPMGWFWHRILVAFGYRPPLPATFRA